jgi:NAD(P)-dependent dehydrogenase (short-subunit alcohol dehydrogenase family)
MNKKYACITGVSTGIGYALLDALWNEGWHVIGSVRNINDAERITALYADNCTVMTFDVRDREGTLLTMSETFSKLNISRLDCLINNAGVAVPGPMQYLSDDDFEMQLDINLKAVRRITNFCLPFLGVGSNDPDNAGRIINISSVSGLFNSPYNGAYCISKHALESLNEVYRRELDQFGIKVVTICPGPVKTEIWKKNIHSMDKYADTEYGAIVQHADRLIQNAEAGAMDVSEVVRVVLEAISARNPNTRYILHRKKLMFRILATLVPDKWADIMVKKALASGEKYRPV